MHCHYVQHTHLLTSGRFICTTEVRSVMGVSGAGSIPLYRRTEKMTGGDVHQRATWLPGSPYLEYVQVTGQQVVGTMFCICWACVDGCCHRHKVLVCSHIVDGWLFKMSSLSLSYCIILCAQPKISKRIRLFNGKLYQLLQMFAMGYYNECAIYLVILSTFPCTGRGVPCVLARRGESLGDDDGCRPEHLSTRGVARVPGDTQPLVTSWYVIVSSLYWCCILLSVLLCGAADGTEDSDQIH